MPKIKTNKPDNENALKHMFNEALLRRLADSLANAYPAFNRREFLKLKSELSNLEMKPRVLLIRDELQKQLPKKYSEALKIILKSMKDENLNGFDFWPFSEFIRTYGLNDLKISLDAMKELTKKFTSEWAIRPFIQRYPHETMKYLNLCALDKNVSVRRWSSEGTRPRLPWGERLQEFVRDPSPTLPILEKLKFDPELFVRKSVSNHLNDIAKDHPDIVIKILKKWKASAPEEHAEKIDWIIQRSLRNLIKQGHSEALNLIGVSSSIQAQVIDFDLKPKKIKMGERLEFNFGIQSRSASSQKLVIDYIIHFVKAGGKTAPKVFKLKTLELPARAKILFTKNHHIKPITTRKYYPGKHFVEIQVNGKTMGKLDWELVKFK